MVGFRVRSTWIIPYIFFTLNRRRINPVHLPLLRQSPPAGPCCSDPRSVRCCLHHRCLPSGVLLIPLSLLLQLHIVAGTRAGRSWQLEIRRWFTVFVYSFFCYFQSLWLLLLHPGRACTTTIGLSWSAPLATGNLNTNSIPLLFPSFYSFSVPFKHCICDFNGY